MGGVPDDPFDAVMIVAEGWDKDTDVSRMIGALSRKLPFQRLIDG